MGLPLVAIAKLSLILHGSRSTTSPVFACFLVPCLIKLCLGYRRFVAGAYSDFVLAVHLFVFQFGQIVARADRVVSGSRWERAFRLVRRRLTEATRPRLPAIDVEASLHTLSMIAL
ncbi:hypothetical protein CDL15_Pgr021525 [Punica granatum]|uniref:Uncharacterized protein n=1 Tax=Punica granatum TaxID=22663 RepID=A0A218XNU6_PUNGR|nr:hypothetical protein CDL15_Pgr021525 [Punica granatum]PKI39805.1 hypothetical protein CRG98_039850 [Punica granatum]